MANVFEIHNLACKYSTNLYPVLNIEEMTIKSGEMVFIVGASGVGKSTILETLGLMNNTAQQNDSSKFQYCHNGTTVNMLEIWNKSERNLASFRRENLSFIFQSTNLFNNLSAFQNVCISQIIQGIEKEKAELNAKRLLKEMFDDKTALEIIHGKKVTELSGGQRQRLAFVRAIVTDYKVLFADEPTGNLDWSNAQKLISVLNKHVKAHSRTAIIVTHDIDLAVNFGDRVILIQKEVIENGEEVHLFGKVSRKSMFIKNQNGWSNNEEGLKSSLELNQYLKFQLN